MLAYGFLEHPDNYLTIENLKEIHDNSLILLYRLLFILYAEARGLLPVDNPIYASFSLDSLKKEIVERLDSPALLVSTDIYWARLRTLFSWINEGSERRKIPRNQLHIPPYNGGLFDPSKHKFLEDKKVGDMYLARAIDLLTRASNRGVRGFVDYSTLSIRHLGSIYEGLLEYKLRIAEEDLYPLRKKSGEVFVPLYEAKQKVNEINEEKIVKKGDLYLVTEKGERKATGSYFTPDYIVKYIVQNTLRPVVEEKLKADPEKSPIEKILSIRVLDPAMGSGHFLVEATSFLASKIIEMLQESGEELSEEQDVTWARRLVVERCIHGVDLNPLAVELAKVSLWLHTVASEKSLAFLDHHLRVGNSLIGAQVEDMIRNVPEARRTIWGSVFEDRLEDVLAKRLELQLKPSDTPEQIRAKQEILKESEALLGHFKSIADVYTSTFFGNRVPPIEYAELIGLVESSEAQWERAEKKDWFTFSNQESKSRRFYNWQLEFPELFFDEQGARENPGFDVVIGNPPYGGKLDRKEEDFICKEFRCFGSKDTAEVFLELALRVTRRGGMMSMIFPKSTAFYTAWSQIREHLLKQSTIVRLCDVGIAFKEVNYEQLIIVTRKNEADERVMTSIDRAKPLKRYRPEKEIANIGEVSQKIMNLENRLIFTSVSPDVEKVIETIHKSSVPLRTIAKEIFRGLYVPDSVKKRLGPGKYKFLEKVPHVSRYNIRRLWEVDLSNPKWEKKIRKILRPRVFLKVLRGKRLVAGYDEGEIVTTEKLENVVLQKDCGYDIRFITAVVNSPVPSLYLQKILFSDTTETSRVMDADYSGSIPIPKISFVTQPPEREKLLGEVIKSYNDSLSKQDFEPTLRFIDEYLVRGKSDVVHDFLAHLAQMMTTYHHLMRREAQGFLSWLEREAGTEIERLRGKTRIRRYHNLTFEDFINILKDNRRRISKDIRSRAFQESIKKEFDPSVVKLRELSMKTKFTDDLIDKIVYKVYGLSNLQARVIESWSNATTEKPKVKDEVQ